MAKNRPNGFDPIGPFHPYVVACFVVLLDIVIIALVLAAIVFVADRVEDVFWPGGPEWVEL